MNTVEPPAQVTAAAPPPVPMGERALLEINWVDTRPMFRRPRGWQAEVTLVLVGMLVMGAVLAIETMSTRTLEARVSALEAQATSVEASTKTVATIERVLVAQGAAAAYIVQMRRSGPVLARRVSAIARVLPDDASATSLSQRSGGWQLVGHVSDAAAVPRVLAALPGAQFNSYDAGSSSMAAANDSRASFTVDLP